VEAVLGRELLGCEVRILAFVSEHLHFFQCTFRCGRRESRLRGCRRSREGRSQDCQLGTSSFQERLEHARILTALVLKNADLDLEAERRKRRYAPSAVDGVALRGIPAVGRFGVGGAIAGTKPGANLFR
jgi:hypothetical protein